MDGISIVIISRGREQLLEELLLSVQKAQKQVDVSTEIVLIDSSLGDAREKVRLLSEKYHTKYFYKDVSVSAKRNYGVQQCQYEVVLFLDSDCLATPLPGTSGGWRSSGATGICGRGYLVLESCGKNAIYHIFFYSEVGKNINMGSNSKFFSKERGFFESRRIR